LFNQTTNVRCPFPGAKRKQLFKIGRNGKHLWTPYVPLGTERSDDLIIIIIIIIIIIMCLFLLMKKTDQLNTEEQLV